jgi:hypothetical protein
MYPQPTSGWKSRKIGQNRTLMKESQSGGMADALDSKGSLPSIQTPHFRCFSPSVFSDPSN